MAGGPRRTPGATGLGVVAGVGASLIDGSAAAIVRHVAARTRRHWGRWTAQAAAAFGSSLTREPQTEGQAEAK
jgi:hypothetical protein